MRPRRPPQPLLAGRRGAPLSTSLGALPRGVWILAESGSRCDASRRPRGVPPRRSMGRSSPACRHSRRPSTIRTALNAPPAPTGSSIRSDHPNRADPTRVAGWRPELECRSDIDGDSRHRTKPRSSAPRRPPGTTGTARPSTFKLPARRKAPAAGRSTSPKSALAEVNSAMRWAPSSAHRPAAPPELLHHAPGPGGWWGDDDRASCRSQRSARLPS
jgi:hypothetical protein